MLKPLWVVCVCFDLGHVPRYVPGSNHVPTPRLILTLFFFFLLINLFPNSDNKFTIYSNSKMIFNEIIIWNWILKCDNNNNKKKNKNNNNAAAVKREEIGYSLWAPPWPTFRPIVLHKILISVGPSDGGDWFPLT